MKSLSKPLFTYLALFLLSSTAGYTQTLKEFLNSKETPTTYLGLDFSLTKLIGDAGANTSDIANRQYGGINDVTVNEPKKYDIAGAFQKSKVDNDIAQTVTRNMSVKPAEIISTNAADYNRLKEADINTLVQGYDFLGKKGIGILFVVEAMSKSEKAAAIWPTIIDMGSHKVLLTERLVGKATGIGFRNYWAGAFLDVLKAIDKRKYDEWKSKYGK
jgi:hypothetical protein